MIWLIAVPSVPIFWWLISIVNGKLVQHFMGDRLVKDGWAILMGPILTMFILSAIFVDTIMPRKK